MASIPDPQPKKRESRAGTRKVTSLSAEQLERKRANDREAQRTIRQRTKEHIERLEHQVAELKSKGEQYDHVVRRNTALENEIRALKQQLSLARSGQAYSGPGVCHPAEGSYNTPSGPVLPSQFTEPLSVNPVSRTPSALSTSSQVSVAPDWQQYGSTGSPSICESSDADYSNRHPKRASIPPAAILLSPVSTHIHTCTQEVVPTKCAERSIHTTLNTSCNVRRVNAQCPCQLSRQKGNFVGTPSFTPPNNINKSRNIPKETITAMTGLVDSDTVGKWSFKEVFLNCGLNTYEQIGH
ncbi:Basic leucine zipper bZIP domain of Activator Protein YAP [Aspergillus parasiticus SU-1]|uniref:Basic leucine zipper bZIP domain of Activator Protein YAP n=1 Tax=Aspergillus parasiticus (strain ATCC 56775 / NRRL 5862 / SRRC 143 / SU-1) TaxID=1403190 RepID=A0A0F0I4Z5_ASPPU|nr:Basic leucine zipper bZIP domain of Activator Protein YAP [Aspergillus parasiticus SU-1]